MSKVFWIASLCTVFLIVMSSIYLTMGEKNMNKKVLFILMPENYQDFEFNVPYQTLQSRGVTIDVAGLKPGVAKGTVTLHNDSAFDQPLIATTRLLTPDGIIFRIKDRVLVPANGTVEVAVYADKEGATGNIGPVLKFTIPGLREDTQKVIYASSDKAMTGGVKTIGVLSEADVKKAEIELSANLEEQGKAILSKMYPDKLAVYSMVNPVLENDGEVGKEVSEFMVKGQATVVGVFYNEDDVKAETNNLLNQRVVSDVENLAKEFDFSVALDNYDLSAGTAVLKLFANGKAELDPTSKQLDKMMFYGKTKDEVRRYLLSLDHVQSVDIKFSPAWMRTVPHVADHVSVVVKEVE